MSFPFNITDKEFAAFKRFIFDEAGIELSNEKRSLVTARLSKRLRHHNLTTFGAYYDLLVASPHGPERQIAIDLLTTNETYFFREPHHFDFLRDTVLKGWRANRPFRIWSAASSSGEEAYSIAMLLDDVLGNRPWEVMGSDINTEVVARAARGHYVMNRIEGIPQDYLRKYCLKGAGTQEGTMLIDKKLRARVQFFRQNLLENYDKVGQFDCIFLRNVMIYFNNETKRQIVRKLARHLVPGGYLVIGSSESIKHLVTDLDAIQPAIYRKPAQSTALSA